MKELKNHAGFLSILGINIVVFLLCLIFPGLIDALALYSDKLISLGWLTCLFDHANLDHLFYNMLFVFPFALYLEPKIGWKRFVAAWLLTGLGGSICFLLTPSLLGGVGGLLGSSGSCFGVMALACLECGEEHPVFSTLALIMLFMLGLREYEMTVITAFISDGIGHAAHLGSAITGLTLYRFLKQ